MKIEQQPEFQIGQNVNVQVTSMHHVFTYKWPIDAITITQRRHHQEIHYLFNQGEDGYRFSERELKGWL